MLSVLRVHLPSDIPIVGCELTPYVLLQCPDTSITTDDVPESSPIDGFCLRYRWYRSKVIEKLQFAVCILLNKQPCSALVVSKQRYMFAKSYHCSPRCFSDARHHRTLHERH
ncbi:hypothetical protein IFM89_004027 [Coptis chinensis]|uniref:Uncharacterized protein n=1 Tax=Coptis chinensis TaxID=261450 RepID=A0A835GV55_9MAGN|nr:hypothetical protein IFM89_004027 [Coptis chinensis]